MEKIIAHFREQALACVAYGSPFTGELIARMAADLEGGPDSSPVGALVGAWPTNPRADALSLRLVGALHFAVLTDRAPALAAQYPASRAGWSIDEVWPLARALLEQDRPWTEEFIQSPPQTNETRRSIGLLAGFLTIAERFALPIDTLELGASAGLNLNWDRFAYRTEAWTWNEGGAVLIDTDWRGPPPPLTAKPIVRARAACDQNPLDIADPAARLRLKSYVWADQADRLARFDAAVALALESGVKVERADAVEWVKHKLAARARDAVTVVYHSIFLQYPPRESRAAIKAAIEAEGARATPVAPLVWLRLEPEALFGGPRDSVTMVIDTITWDGASPQGERRILGETDGHVRAIESKL